MTEKFTKNLVSYQGREYFVKNNTLDLSLLGIIDITNIEGLNSLTNLKSLNLSGNQISKIGGLDGLIRLE